MSGGGPCSQLRRLEHLGDCVLERQHGFFLPLFQLQVHRAPWVTALYRTSWTKLSRLSERKLRHILTPTLCCLPSVTLKSLVFDPC